MNVYFAYGSNLCLKTMKNRCKSAEAMGIARLSDYQLAFTRQAKRRGCGVADIIIRPDSEVWGALYRISDEELSILDKHEGAPRAYRRIPITVHISKAPSEVFTYEVVNKVDGPVPSSEYFGEILTGATEHRLPKRYIGQLRELAGQFGIRTDDG